MGDRNIIILWLGICAVLIFAMVLLGGAVRLTGSGLSMVDWKPIMGVIPPMSEESWFQAFQQYQQFPEYQNVNRDISMGEFKFIYLMEYAHRILGRLIGLVFFIPFVYLIITKKLNGALIPRLWFLFFMGVVQGGMGWYMVKSGLVDNPQVSQYRLVFHLIIAIIIYAYMIRILAGLFPQIQYQNHSVNIFGRWVIGILFIMLISGGFVAGTHAGFIYNTFLDMGGNFVPPQLMDISPLWKNLFENPVTIQFVHRLLAVVVLLAVSIYGMRLYLNDQIRFGRKFSAVLMIAVALQFFLGVITLIAKVPLALGVSHQAGALILLTAMVVSVSAGAPLLEDDEPVQ